MQIVNLRVNMKKIFLFAILANISLSFAQTADTDFIPLTEALKDHNLKYSEKERILSNHIATLFDMGQNQFLDKKRIDQTLRDSSKFEVFTPFKGWLSQLSFLAGARDATKINQLCSKFLEESHAMAPLLTRNIENLCANLFIEKLSSEIVQKRYRFSESNKTFLKLYTHLIYERVANKKLADFLDRSAKTDFYPFISNAFEEMMIEKNIVPANMIVSKLALSDKFQMHIQKNGLYEASSMQVFYDELDFHSAEVIKLADAGVSKEMINKKVDQIRNFFNLSQDKLPLKKSYDRLSVVGKALLRRKYFEPSRAVFQTILSSSSIDQKDEAAFDIIWSFLSEKKNKNAIAFIKNTKLVEDFDKIEEPKLMFWVANTLLDENKKLALELHSKILKNYPLSYYAILATRVIKENDSKMETLNEVIPKTLDSQEKIAKLSWNKENKHALKRLRLWTKLGHMRFQELERDYLASSTKDPAMNIVTAKVLGLEKDYLASFKVIYRSLYAKEITLTHDILSILYPRPFWEAVVNTNSSIDPILAISLIRQESGFNPEAKSRVGATGLMQLMPTTAQMFQKRVTPKNLEDPFLNIKIGTQYFSKLLKRYDDNIVHSLAAYNAGESRVDRWQNEYFHGDSTLHHIEEIPFLETKKYVKLIFRNVFFYKFLEEPTTVASSENLNSLFTQYLHY